MNSEPLTPASGSLTKGKRELLLLVVAVALGLFLANRFLGDRGEGARHDFADMVEVCVENQRALYSALVLCAREQGGLPAADAGAGLDILLDGGYLGDTPAQRALLTCPGAVDGADRYVLRDSVVHPLESFPSGGISPVLACPQSGNAGHSGILNVLFADGSVRTLVLEQLIEQGHLPVGSTEIRPGPGSAYGLLQVFPAQP